MNYIEYPDVLISQKKIRERNEYLGKKIAEDFQGKDFSILCVLKGCIPFVADLIRNISIPFKIDVIHASSYINKESKGTVDIVPEPKLDLSGRHILIIDDILDTGRTLLQIKSVLKHQYDIKGIKTCVLLDKPSRRTEPIQADYRGFEIPNLFVVGYGLDLNEYYRNLPYIGQLQSE